MEDTEVERRMGGGSYNATDFLVLQSAAKQQQFVVWSLAATADTDRTQMPKMNHRMVNYQSIYNYKNIISTYEQSGLVWCRLFAGMQH